MIEHCSCHVPVKDIRQLFFGWHRDLLNTSKTKILTIFLTNSRINLLGNGTLVQSSVSSLVGDINKE